MPPTCSERKRLSQATSVSIIVLPTRCIARRVDALGAEVRERLVRVGEEQIGELVGDDAVDLLGHRAVEAAQPRLEVGDRDPELGGDERRGERRVHVAGNDHEVRALASRHGLEPLHHARRLLARGVPDPTPSR